MSEDGKVPSDRRERIAADPYCATLGIDLVELPRDAPRGAVYSLADAAFAAASNSRGETALALETNISYLEAAETGTTLTATAEETHLGRHTAEYEVVVTDADGDRIAAFRGRVYRP